MHTLQSLISLTKKHSHSYQLQYHSHPPYPSYQPQRDTYNKTTHTTTQAAVVEEVDVDLGAGLTEEEIKMMRAMGIPLV